ncbi:hypothetical protein Bun01g_39100 (plasmid) [Bacteroides uniformis]|uniref:Uncharacterized protein n=1 Tax=Bacteroides uniformis TaxID=820 RepID=A0A4Y1VMW9_BACUN|nr:hypothetical protein Bun01g_39100 [Bacteroides uniformis]
MEAWHNPIDFDRSEAYFYFYVIYLYDYPRTMSGGTIADNQNPFNSFSFFSR